VYTGRSWLCPPATALTVARNWASSSGKLAVYSSSIMHMYSSPGLDRIANEVLKEVHKELVLYLTEAFTAAAHLGYYSKIKKSITTVALHKDGKADYSLINSYRPITLENTIVKIYKKLLVILISQKAKKWGLLPLTQIEVRLKRSTFSALELIDETVHTA
jgi:hypothetical protein